MARSEVNYVVTVVTPFSGKVAAANGALVQINLRNADGSSGAAATLFSTPDTGSTRVNPVATDSAGRISRDGSETWLDPGRYNLVISGSGLLNQTVSFDAPGEAFVTVASAATITAPAGAKVINITGTTGITSVTAAAVDAGRLVSFVFTDILTVTDGSNLKLSSNYTTAADNTLTMACDGTNWYELARSVN